MGWGVVKSLELIGSGPVGLLHTQKVRNEYKKPSYSGLRGECSAWICCRVSRAIDPQFCKPKVGSSILSTGTISYTDKTRVSRSFAFVLPPIPCCKALRTDTS